jgi:tetratricopeptide (TPR) repeat protein
LYGLAIVLRDRGDFAGAGTALGQALDVCERAGLIAQSIQAIAARAEMLTMADKLEEAAEAAQEASELAERLHYPVGQAAALEAAGFALGEIEKLDAAREAWLAIGRPLDAGRCRLLTGRLLLETDPVQAAAVLEEASAEFERLSVPQLAQRARELLAIG